MVCRRALVKKACAVSGRMLARKMTERWKNFKREDGKIAAYTEPVRRRKSAHQKERKGQESEGEKRTFISSVGRKPAAAHQPYRRNRVTEKVKFPKDLRRTGLQHMSRGPSARHNHSNWARGEIWKGACPESGESLLAKTQGEGRLGKSPLDGRRAFRGSSIGKGEIDVYRTIKSPTSKDPSGGITTLRREGPGLTAQTKRRVREKTLAGQRNKESSRKGGRGRSRHCC